MVIGPVGQKEQTHQNCGGVGQLALPVLYHGQHQSVSQSEDHRQGAQGIHAHFAVEGPGQSGKQYIGGQEKARAQQAAGDPDLDLIVVQRGQPYKVEGRHQ